MAISVFEAARYAGQKTNWSKSNLELQKIIYIANLLHIGEHDTPLVDGSFQAWHLGPVHPDLYRKAKVFGADPVKDIFHAYKLDEDKPEIKSLDSTLDKIADYSGSKLVAVTHSETSAWYNNYNPGERHIVIPYSDIRDEYKKRKRVEIRAQPVQAVTGND